MERAHSERSLVPVAASDLVRLAMLVAKAKAEELGLATGGYGIRATTKSGMKTGLHIQWQRHRWRHQHPHRKRPTVTPSWPLWERKGGNTTGGKTECRSAPGGTDDLRPVP